MKKMNVAQMEQVNGGMRAIFILFAAAPKEDTNDVKTVVKKAVKK